MARTFSRHGFRLPVDVGESFDKVADSLETFWQKFQVHHPSHEIFDLAQRGEPFWAPQPWPVVRAARPMLISCSSGSQTYDQALTCMYNSATD